MRRILSVKHISCIVQKLNKLYIVDQIPKYMLPSPHTPVVSASLSLSLPLISTNPFPAFNRPMTKTTPTTTQATSNVVWHMSNPIALFAFARRAFSEGDSSLNWFRVSNARADSRASCVRVYDICTRYNACKMSGGGGVLVWWGLGGQRERTNEHALLRFIETRRAPTPQTCAHREK